MKVMVTNLQSKTSELNELIKRYEDNIFQIYNVLNESDANWDDKKSDNFFKDTKLEKIEVEESLEEIKNIKSIYDLIITKYGMYGKEVHFEVKEKNTIINMFDNYINEINKVIIKISNLDLSFTDESLHINNIKQELETEKQKMINVKNNINKTLEEIESIENEINSKIKNLDIKEIRNTDITAYMYNE